MNEMEWQTLSPGQSPYILTFYPIVSSQQGLLVYPWSIFVCLLLGDQEGMQHGFAIRVIGFIKESHRAKHQTSVRLGYQVRDGQKDHLHKKNNSNSINSLILQICVYHNRTICPCWDIIHHERNSSITHGKSKVQKVLQSHQRRTTE